MRLAIISHTEHYTNENGNIVGWSPTVNEINHLLDVFDSIVHIAMHYDTAPPLSTMKYNSDKISFVSIPAVGGTTLLDKFNVLWQAPKIIKIVFKVLKEVDCFQLRTPTGIGVFLIPYLTFFTKKKGWFKYAGNWNQKKPPLGYRFQRFMLKHQSRKVTINGHWGDQPKHCITFENPCLTLEDVNNGRGIIKQKHLKGQLSFCFVGRLEKEKGVERIIKAFTLLSETEKLKVKVVHLVGDGENTHQFEALSNNSGIHFIFHGALSRDGVFEVYKQSEIFLLPSTASEGFPKVIAEAMNFGCIPLVSDISSMSHYIKPHINGFLLNSVNTQNLMTYLQTLISLQEHEYLKLLQVQQKLSEMFTFSYYNSRIKNDILKSI